MRKTISTLLTSGACGAAHALCDTIMAMRWFGRKQKRTRKQYRDMNPKLVLIRQIVVGVLLVVLVALCLTGVWYGTRVAALTITEVEVIGGETIDHETVRELAESELTGTYYKLIPRAFAWLYPEESIAERIAAIDRIKHVHVERTAGKKIVIAFEEYRPFALWCAQRDSTECLFLNRDGYAFAPAPKLQGGAFVRFSEVGRAPEQYTVGFAPEYITDTTTFIDRTYAELGLNIVHVEKTGKEELVYYIAGGGELKVTRRQTTDETFDNLQTILGSEAFDHIEPGNFQYIDLRYGNKVFVNEEDPTLQTAASTTATSSTATSSDARDI